MYWFFESRNHQRAIVHRGDCTFCQNGDGLHGPAHKDHGKWHGPFNDRDVVMDAAKRTGLDDARGCKVCSP